jgi:flagellar biosynthesis anti-sigma factor FlgM
MRIDPNVVVSPIKPVRTDEASKQPQKPESGSSASVVQLSSAAQSAGTAAPGVAARVDKIRAMLDAGQYPVDLDKLASSMVDDEIMRTKKS